jgi:4-hydroxy-tetrahydrodipicolinate reductase
MGCSLLSCAAKHPHMQHVTTLDASTVILDFSVSQAAVAHIQAAQSAQKPLVLGTTDLPTTAFQALKEASKVIPIIQSANFSIGIALFLEFAEKIGSTLYDRSRLEIFETHHVHKKDRPSGTALTLTRALHPTAPEEIPIHSQRLEEAIGEHQLTCSLPHETLEIKHTAHSRAAFAQGALFAAEWLLSQPPGLYTLKDLFSDAHLSQSRQ